MHRRLVSCLTDISRKPLGPILKGRKVQGFRLLDHWRRNSYFFRNLVN